MKSKHLFFYKFLFGILLLFSPSLINASILIYEESSDTDMYQLALTSLGKTFEVASSLSEFETKINDGTAWELVIYSDYNATINTQVIDELEIFASNGGLVLFAHWDIESISSDSFLDLLGISFVSEFSIPLSFTTSSGFLPSGQNSFTPTLDQYNTDGQIVNALSGTAVLASFDDNSNPAIVLNSNQNTIVNLFQAYNFDADLNSDSEYDILVLLKYEIIFLLSAFNETDVPVANFTSSSPTVPVGTSISFFDFSTGVPTSWSWSFPGGTPSTSTEENPTVVYSSEGTYNVTLTVTNAEGTNSITKTNYVAVTNSYTMPSSGTNTLTTCSTLIYDNGGESSNYSNSVNSTLTIYPASVGNSVHLNFISFRTESGYDYLRVYDGTSTSATLIGSYNGSTVPSPITATNPDGALTINFSTDGSSTYSGFEIAATCIGPQVPVANFEAGNTTVPVGSSVQFTDLSTGIPATWSWSFPGGNPATSQEESPIVSYDEIGTYSVSLTVTNSEGTHTITKPDYITVTNFYIMSTSGSNTLTTCDAVIYDDGGEAGDYSNSVNSTLTIYPATEGHSIRIAFDEFNLESGYDDFDVYNGTSTSASLIGSFSGSTIPSSILATNTDGALTIRFTSDGSATRSGFAVRTSCEFVPDYFISETYWSSIIDNDYDEYAQSAQLNFTIRNITDTEESLYAKIYYRSGSGAYQAYSITSIINASGNSITPYTVTIDELQINEYDFRIELYNESGTFFDAFDYTDNINLQDVGFEYSSTDIYCVTGLSGDSFDISEVEILGTPLSNTDERPEQISSSNAYYTLFPEQDGYTCTMKKGNSYQIKVTTTENDVVSVWIDFNQNGMFESTEWTSITTESNASSKTASITIPTTALNGRTLMRIRSSSISQSISHTADDACTYFTSGCTEDYFISIGIATPIVTFDGSILRSNALTGNQWYDDNGPIEGADKPFYRPTEDGNYYVIVTVNQESSNQSNILRVVALNIDSQTTTNDFIVFPIPTQNYLTVSWNDEIEYSTIQILSGQGQIIFSQIINNNETIDVSNLCAGVYYIRRIFEHKIIVQKFIKE